MKTYELTYIISPEISLEEAEAKGKEIEKAISGREGAILKQLNPVARTFSYPIGKKASGFFANLEFQLEPEKLLELKEIIEKDGKIVRHMIIIKQAAEMKKERRTRTKPVLETATVSNPAFVIEQKTETEKPASAKASAGKEKEKVELKDIEQTLDELLGE
ncbi:MAG: 30S ribosomal protein S6 [Candidatus Staskawiczbacteria bacterium]|nr:30S ribosomal protein S6 [Candidatus Staskawiczbacteria bacterium]